MWSLPELYPLVAKRPRVVNTLAHTARSALSGWNPGAASWFATFADTTCLARTITENGVVHAF